MSDDQTDERQYYCKICSNGPLVRTTRFCPACKQPTAGNLRPWPPPGQSPEPTSPTQPHQATTPVAGGTDDSSGERDDHRHPQATRRDGGLALRFPFGDVPVGRELRIGREPTFSPLAEKLAAWDNVSREHAVITVRDGCCTVTDLGSANGTWVNEVRLAYDEPTALAAGDRVRFAARLVADVVEGPVP